MATQNRAATGARKLVGRPEDRSVPNKTRQARTGRKSPGRETFEQDQAGAACHCGTKDQSGPDPSRVIAPVLLTPAQAAGRLGTPERFVRRLIAERRIEFVKVGRYVRIDPVALTRFVEAGRVPPAA